MRHILISTAVILSFAPFCTFALADQIEATAPVRQVTMFPWGASITRELSLTPPAGAHELVIAGLPLDTDPATLRVSGSGAAIGPISLQEGRALPATPSKTPEVIAAEAEVNRLETALNERDARVAEIRARAQAADDTVTFLLTLAGSDNATQGNVVELSQTVGAQILQARQVSIAAETEARTAEQGRDDQQAALDAARARLEALRAPEEDHKTLVIAIESTAQPIKVEITSLSQNANWQPIYDAWLDRPAASLKLDRGMMVAQNTGEDWRDIRLSLSTARPSDQTAPSVLAPIFEHAADYSRKSAAKSSIDYSDELERTMDIAPAAPVMAEMMAAPTSALPRLIGGTLVYDYPTPVTIRNGVDALRLELDSRTLTPDIRAEAVPTRDATAFLVAETTNTQDEILLPGPVTLYLAGTLAGRGDLGLIAPGDRLKLGFGPIDGLIAEFQVPKQAEGDRGILSKSNVQSRSAILRVKNLTGESWPLRVIGQVPVSKQEDLKIGWSAEPQPTTQDRDGERGILEWDSTIAPGSVQDIKLDVDMRWPDGLSLSGNY